MIPPLKISGYTLLETLIFIVISGFILVSAVALFNGRQEQVQYRQSVRELDGRILTTINDVSNGYFPDAQFSCSKDESSDNLVIKTITSDPDDQQGSREDCVFAGKALVYDARDQLAIHSIAAARSALGAPATLLSPDTKLTDIGAIAQDYQLAWGVEIEKMVVSNNPNDSAASNDISYFAYLSDLGKSSSASSNLESGQQAIRLYTSTGNLPSTTIHSDLVPLNANEAIYLCLTADFVNQKAVIILGEDGRQLSTSINQDAEVEYGVVCAGW
ncbi:MAG: hypothetical protein LC687_08275 [Actinobacteria bacterium]|nr:hypothetical protein [Actinomycetota bacterium]